MDNEKFKLVLSAPIDKNGFVIKLAIDEGLHTLHIKHIPEFIWYVFGLLGLFLIVGLALLIDWETLIYGIILLGIILYNIFNERAINCTINKKTGLINYHCSGILMTSFDEQRSKYNISEIKRLEMQRYIRGGRWGWADKFQIFLLLEKGQRIPLSPSNLDFGECQEFAEQIHNFIGKEIPMKALD